LIHVAILGDSPHPNYTHSLNFPRKSREFLKNVKYKKMFGILENFVKVNKD